VSARELLAAHGARGSARTATRAGQGVRQRQQRAAGVKGKGWARGMWHRTLQRTDDRRLHVLKNSKSNRPGCQGAV
jgi:hypothetical protein